jgi:hypothetical protein
LTWLNGTNKVLYVVVSRAISVGLIAKVDLHYAIIGATEFFIRLDRLNGARLKPTFVERNRV